MTEQYAFILKAKTRPEKAEAFERLFRAYVEPSRQEPGCIEYHMLRDKQDPSLFVFYEVWASKADRMCIRPCRTCANFSNSAWSTRSAISTSS